MNVTNYKVRILPRARLPYEMIKGTEAQRFQLAEKLTDDYFLAIKDLFTRENNSVKTNILLEKIYDVLPKTISVELLPFVKPNDSVKGQAIYYAKNNYSNIFSINKTAILMPFTKKKKEINCRDIAYLMHEFRHVADYLTSPKIPVRGIDGNVNIPEIQNEKLQCFFDKEIYERTQLNFIKRFCLNIKLNKILKNLTDEQKVTGLQSMRTSLATEKNAYFKMLGYQSIIDRQVGLKRPLKTDIENSAEFDFDRKLKFINKKLYRTIKNIRRQMHKESISTSQ